MHLKPCHLSETKSFEFSRTKTTMSGGIFAFDIIATLALSSLLLWSYGDWLRQRLFVTLSVLIAWYFSFLIIFVLPLDVSSTIYRQCLNRSEPEDSIKVSLLILNRIPK